MASLAASAVTLTRTGTEGGLHLKERRVFRVSLVLTAQGGTTNLIPASVLGLTTLERATTFYDAGNSKIITASTDGTNLYLAGAGANSQNPTDYTGTIVGEVAGL